ncbi:hypothetical protein ACFFLM_15715 [Deinococcus oregonensis]|uniref:Uncharacterized protein n=1 Tax=Deinococcus oregonensis TaxID=1805970 RepID=A0ABV6B0Y9_9DEIO
MTIAAPFQFTPVSDFDALLTALETRVAQELHKARYRCLHTPLDTPGRVSLAAEYQENMDDLVVLQGKIALAQLELQFQREALEEEGFDLGLCNAQERLKEDSIDIGLEPFPVVKSLTPQGQQVMSPDYTDTPLF